MRERGKQVTTLPVERFDDGSAKGTRARPGASNVSHRASLWDNEPNAHGEEVNDDGG